MLLADAIHSMIAITIPMKEFDKYPLAGTIRF